MVDEFPEIQDHYSVNFERDQETSGRPYITVKSLSTGLVCPCGFLIINVISYNKVHKEILSSLYFSMGKTRVCLDLFQ